MASERAFRRALIRLVPASFLVGAGFEAFMALVPVGGRTFYDVARRKRAERIVDAELAEEDRRRAPAAAPAGGGAAAAAAAPPAAPA